MINDVDLSLVFSLMGDLGLRRTEVTTKYTYGETSYSKLVGASHPMVDMVEYDGSIIMGGHPDEPGDSAGMHKRL